MSKIINLRAGKTADDIKASILFKSLKDVIYKNGEDMSVASIIGVIEVLKVNVMEEQSEV